MTETPKNMAGDTEICLALAGALNLSRPYEPSESNKMCPNKPIQELRSELELKSYIKRSLDLLEGHSCNLHEMNSGKSRKGLISAYIKKSDLMAEIQKKESFNFEE